VLFFNENKGQIGLNQGVEQKMTGVAKLEKYTFKKFSSVGPKQLTLWIRQVLNPRT